MDHRRSSFLIGSRTRTNVLKGKNVRKQDDGADNFADYWTDSGGEDTSTDSDNYSDLSKIQKEPNASEIRLKSLRQNVRTISSSSILHSGTKVKDKQGHTKILTSSLRPVKNKVSDYDKNIHNSPTKEQKVSSKLQRGKYQNSAISVNNVFNPSDQSRVRSECSLTTTISQHSVSDSEGPKKQTEITATSALPKIKNRVKSSQISSSTFLTSNNNKKENTKLNTSHHSANSLRDSVKKKASPLLQKSKGKEKKIVSPKKSLVSRNLNETISLPPASDCNDISTGSLSPISKQSEERRKTFVINENVSQDNLDASDIHMLSSVKVISADTNPTNATGSESLANKTLHERNSHIDHKEVSSIFKSGCRRNHTVMKMRNSSQISKTFDKYDEYDAKIMEMVNDNENMKVLAKEQTLTLSSPKPTEENKVESSNSESDAEYEEINVVAQNKTDKNVKNQNSERVSNNKILSRSQQKISVSRDRINAELFQSRSVSAKENFELADISHTSLHNHKSQTENVLLSKSVKNLAHSSQASGRNVNVSLHKKKSSDIKSFLKRKSTSRTSPHKPILSNKKNRQHSTLYSSNILPKSTDKNDSETNDASNNEIYEAANVSNINEDAYVSHVSDILDNDLLRSHKLKSCIDKSKEKPRTPKSFSRGTIENAAENHEILKQPTSLYNKQEKFVNEIQENLKASETFSRDNAENALDTSESENEIPEDLDSRKRKHARKIHKSALDTSESENEIPEDLDSKKRKHVSKIHKSALDTSESENEIPEDLDSKKRKHTRKIHKSALDTSESENEIPEDLDSKKRKHVSKIHKSTLDTSESENEIPEDLDSKKRKHVIKIHKNLKVSKTVSRDNNVTDISSKGNEMSQNFDNEKRKNVNKTHKKVKASETFSAKNTESAIDIPANENEISQNLNSKKKKHVNKIPKISNALRSFLNDSAKSTSDIPANEIEISQNFDNGREKHGNNTHENLESSGAFSTGVKNVNKTHKNMRASETFSTKNTERVTDIPANVNEISQNLNSKKEIHVNKIPKISKAVKSSLNDNAKSATDIPESEIEISQNFDNKRKKHANNTHENMVVFSTESAENAADVPAKERETMQNLHIKRKKPVSKIYENLETSRTLSKNTENIDPEMNNGGTPNFHGKKKNTKDKNKKNQNASETFIRDNRNTDNFLEAETGTTSIHKKRKKRATESLQNLSLKENNDQLVSSRKKKKGNEIHSAEENAPLRRSVRQKFPPLALWRNERLLYRIENGITGVIGIDKGTGEDDVVIKRLQRKLQRNLGGEKKKKKIKAVKKCDVQDIVNKKKARAVLVRHFDSIPWDKGHQGTERSYRIKRAFESDTYASGFIQIEANEEKPMQYMPNEDICLTVIKGKIEVTIQKNVNLVEARGTFIVPKCVPYCIKNVTSTKALLTFCVGKFRYLESH